MNIELKSRLSKKTTKRAGKPANGEQMKTSKTASLQDKCDNKSKLTVIAKKLNLLRQEKALTQQKNDDLRKQAMELMSAGGKCQTKFGTIKFNKQQQKKIHSKESLRGELARRNYPESEIDKILEASCVISETRAHIVFCANKQSHRTRPEAK